MHTHILTNGTLQENTDRLLPAAHRTSSVLLP